MRDILPSTLTVPFVQPHSTQPSLETKAEGSLELANVSILAFVSLPQAPVVFMHELLIMEALSRLVCHMLELALLFP